MTLVLRFCGTSQHKLPVNKKVVLIVYLQRSNWPMRQETETDEHNVA